ncbi:unnamed protein product [Parajaminaea phylloscopi]
MITGLQYTYRLGKACAGRHTFLAPRSFSTLLGQPSPEIQSLAERLVTKHKLGVDPSNLASTPSLFVQPVIWGDHDTFQHLNNVRYVRFFESARMSFAEGVAKDLPEPLRSDILTGKGSSFILAGIDVKFRRPVTYPDTLVIASKILEPLEEGADRFTLHAAAYSLKAWEAYRQKVEAAGENTSRPVREPGPVCTADQLCVSYDYKKLSKAPLSDALRKALASCGGQTTL